jgi:hypothetical protein
MSGGAKSIALKAGGTVLLAGALLVLFVLPAETGTDLTGLGKKMGLTALASSGEITEVQRGAIRGGQVFALSDAPVKTDRWTFELGPFKSIEFKYTLAKGSAMLFEWNATGELYYYMHAHPFKGGTKLTEAYSEGDGTHQKGSYVAPFEGIHGWYWQNRSPRPVTVTLEATGAFSTSTIFNEFGEQDRPIPAKP